MFQLNEDHLVGIQMNLLMIGREIMQSIFGQFFIWFQNNSSRLTSLILMI